MVFDTLQLARCQIRLRGGSMSDLHASQVEVNQLMQRIRAEVEKRRSEHTLRVERDACVSNEIGRSANSSLSRVYALNATNTRSPAVVSLSLADPILETFGPRVKQAPNGSYHIRDLLRYHDREFIHAAYRAMLFRAPDEDGMNTYVRHLRNGMPKVEILRALAESSEGQAAAASISGLSKHLRLLKFTRLPVIGGLISYVAALCNIQHIARRLQSAETYIISAGEHAQERLALSVTTANHALRDVERAYNQLAEYCTTRAEVDRNAMNDIHASLGALKDALGEIRSRESRH